MTKEEQISSLAADNPRAPREVLDVYVTALAEYRAADANIAELGTVVAHPRTGAPIDNPMMRVRDAALRRMRACKLRRTDSVWVAP